MMHFSNPYPDEILYSVLARYSVAVGLQVIKLSWRAYLESVVPGL